MPKARFHEIYQDYVCSCMLRVAREVFAILPVETLLVTARQIWRTRDRTYRGATRSFRSDAANDHRPSDFERLDPSDALDNFQHRGDFKATRKSGALQPITPLTPSDITHHTIKDMGFRDLLAAIQKMRQELKAQIAELTPGTHDALPQASP